MQTLLSNMNDEEKKKASRTESSTGGAGPLAKVENAVKMMEETRKMLSDLDDAAPQFARQALQSVLRAREKLCREATKEAFGAEIEEDDV